MTKPLVSVAMPAYNAQATLRAAVEAVLAQTMPKLELIVCNDASTDGTAKILDTIKDERLKVVSNAVNLGEGGARDRAMDKASAPWVALIDADDAWEPDRLERLLSVAGSPDKTLVFDNIMVCHDVKGRLVPWRPIRGKRAFGDKRKRCVDTSLENYLISDRLLMKPLMPTRFLRKTGIHHSRRRFGGDTEFFIRLAAAGARFRYLSDALYLYRVTPTSATARATDHSLMRQCLEDCFHERKWSPGVERAFRTKISMLHADEVLYDTRDRMQNREFLAAMRTLLSSRAALKRLPKRALPHLRYQLHRLIHGGVGR